ncbi:MAG TPA: ATP/GTP-binding protein [Burkholderiaceae bacterium]|nr:ATP/GTP-binding protein [Burkholderiaceae bacterium]HMX11341.1 ATP/GTP-binding protein [Burkholderiaceae bacterium]HMZ00316.1 ATP/GTP-binding protein [Burkholderiaceae bacterium]HNB43254.1 ATP/GTP-binding protein [Burkholderiaceae bacterium]HNG81014.1 ATP/GTP-binding protein [Burkholderiaceae bacterium]
MAHTDHKIIFTGPVGAGKTTAIASISDIEPIRTDENASDMTTRRKPATTVAMDYGMIRIGPKEKVHLYGTPGQERFDFMWEILTKGGIGLVLLLDNTRPAPFEDMRFYVTAFREFIESTRLVVGVTQMDSRATPTIDEYVRQMREMDLVAPVFEVDARRRDDVSALIQALLLSIDPTL